jgi:HNH endonuclease
MPTSTKVCARCSQQYTITSSPAIIARQKFCSRRCVADSHKDIPDLMTSLRQKLESRVEKRSDGCHIYTGQNNGHYGQLEYKRKTYLAHRASYMVFKGEIPEGKLVCHSCDVRLCINPEHLWIGTHADNVNDMHAKGRARYNPRSKLTDGAVNLLIEEVKNGSTITSVALKYGVSQSMASMYASGKRKRASST